MAAPRRTERVSDEIRRRLTELIRRELKDPRVSFLSSITRVQMSPDLRYAKVFVSVMGTPDEQQQTVQVLTRAAGFLRHHLGVDLRLRHTPELHFVLDQSIAEGDRILRLMREVEREQQQP
jgi:ribosome-binding factor A